MRLNWFCDINNQPRSGRIIQTASVVLCCAVILVACGGVSQAQAEKNAESIVDDFFMACVQTEGDANQAMMWAQQHGWKQLDQQEIDALPFGMLALGASKVWQYHAGGHTSFYLHAEKEECTLLASHADVAKVAQQFEQKALSAPSSFEAKLRADNYTAVPFPYRQQIFAWWQKGADEEILLTANTSPSDYLPAQAVLIYSRHPLKPAVSDNLNHSY